MSRTTTKIIISEKDGAVVGQFFLEQGEHLIGRMTHCSIRLKSDDVSREHARLIISADAIEIEDLDSTWGTYLDDVPVKGRTPIQPTQKLRISDLRIEIERQGFEALAEGSRLGEGVAEAVEVEPAAAEPAQKLGEAPIANIGKTHSGKNYSKLIKIAGIAAAGFVVLGIVLWLFVFRAPTENNLTDIELDQVTGTVYLKGSSEPFTGKAVSKYPSGQVKVEIIFSNGKEEGPYSIWYENGKLLHQADYSSGTFSGSVKWWDENGALLFESSYVGGKETILKTNGILSIPPGAIPGITERQN